ncbi:MAG: glycerophosphodiester phosphodiesterase family protein [Alphaproteobacteria bacterium]|nr:MAG: glycerophosphodiester phosphodiesterase family protein [Alphaproteobacteria bacterium]
MVRFIKHLMVLALFALSGFVHAEQVPPPADRNSFHQLHIPEGGLPAFFRWQPTRLPLVSHHRGGGPVPGYPENAIETMENALRYGPGLMEIDIATLADGTMVLMHDDTLDRTTTGSGTLAEMSWNDIKDVQLKDSEGAVTPYHIPTLEDALKWAKGRAILTLDIKKGTDFARVADAVRRAGAMDYVAGISYTLDQAREFYAAAPEMMLTVTMRNADEVAAVKASGIAPDRIIAWTGTRLQDPAFYGLLHANGWRAIVGTLGDSPQSIDNQILASGDDSRYLAILGMGADVIATDRFWAVQRQILNPNLYFFVLQRSAAKAQSQ